MSSDRRPFEDLTEVGRAKRLRPLAFAALESYDIEVSRLRLITNSWNCVFRVDTTSGERFAFRITLPRPERRREVVRAEAQFMAAVGENTDVTVPTPVPNRQGELVTEASADGVPQPRDCVLFTWVTGRDLGDIASGATYRRLGEVMATMHEFALGWTPPSRLPLVTYDTTIHMGEPTVLFDDEAMARYEPEHRQCAAEWVARCDANVAAVHERGPIIVTHGDMHHWNVMVDRGRFAVIDFEDLQWAAPILDVATTLYYVRWGDDYQELFEGFLAGYSSVRPWVETFDGELEPLIAARGIDLLNVCLDDPELDMDLTEFSARIWNRCAQLLGT